MLLRTSCHRDKSIPAIALSSVVAFRANTERSPFVQPDKRSHRAHGQMHGGCLELLGVFISSNRCRNKVRTVSPSARGTVNSLFVRNPFYSRISLDFGMHTHPSSCFIPHAISRVSAFLRGKSLHALVLLDPNGWERRPTESSIAGRGGLQLSPRCLCLHLSLHVRCAFTYGWFKLRNEGFHV